MLRMTRVDMECRAGETVGLRWRSKRTVIGVINYLIEIQRL